MALISRHLFIG